MKHRVYRFRLDDADAARLQREADEARLSKADLIRRSLGWDLADRGPRSPTMPIAAAPTTTDAVDPEQRPGLSAIQQIQEKLKGA